MICVPIVGASMPKALDQITAAEKVADIFIRGLLVPEQTITTLEGM